MTELTLSISNKKDESLIRKLLAKFDSVTIKESTDKCKTGIDEALEDVAAGRVTEWENLDDFFNAMKS